MFASTIAVLFLYTVAAIGQTFTLNVEIAPNQLTVLKSSGYNLCVAKKVNGNYTVVWSGNQQYLGFNDFQWKESYQVFGSDEYEVGALVSVATNSEDIQFGQTSVLTEAGVMNPATGSVSGGTFYVNNQYGLIGLAVNALLGDGYLPIYVSNQVVASVNSFEPITTVSVWFSISQTTSTMYFTSETPAIEVVYDGTTTQTVSYSGTTGKGVWSLGPLPPADTVPGYGQCGGLEYTGNTVCVLGYTCQYSNPYYSQCL